MRINISDLSRRTSLVGKAIYKDIGVQLANALWKEFERLIVETPQWSGTAAASWNMAFGQSSGGVREQPQPKNAQEALQKGHNTAVSVALVANNNALDEIATKYRFADLSVWNDAPSIEKAEYGPLRQVNTPGRAFVDFKSRVQAITITLGNYDI